MSSRGKFSRYGLLFFVQLAVYRSLAPFDARPPASRIALLVHRSHRRPLHPTAFRFVHVPSGLGRYHLRLAPPRPMEEQRLVEGRCRHAPCYRVYSSGTFRSRRRQLLVSSRRIFERT
jgi:hypothetical protein